MSKIYFNLDEVMWKARVKSINKLSDMTGICRPALTGIQNNKSKMVHLSTLERICDTLNCDINELVKYEK